MGISEVADTVTAAAAVSANLLAIYIARKVHKQQQEIAKTMYQQEYDLAGAEAAIAWRNQVIDLHDRGMSPEQIRRVMLLEVGGEGYEPSNGHIDEIVAEIPRRS
jgi:hypothetical protein